MADDKYSGFTNYETWVTVLWLENDEKLNRAAKDQAIGASFAFDDTPERDRYFENWMEVSLTATEGIWDSHFPVSREEKKLMKKDIGSMWRVNWKEVVDRMIAD